MSAYSTLNGVPVFECRITLPRVGVWHADVVLDSEDNLSGQATLSYAGGALDLHGTVRNGGNHLGANQLLLVGGADGWATPIEPKAFRNATFQTVLTDVLRVAGESLSPAADQGLLGAQLPWWVRVKGTCGHALQCLMGYRAGAVWRVLTDGTLWVGVETWDQLNLPYELLHEAPQANRMTLYSETPALVPGATFASRHVALVEHLQDAGGTRTVVHFEGQEGDSV